MSAMDRAATALERIVRERVENGYSRGIVAGPLSPTGDTQIVAYAGGFAGSDAPVTVTRSGNDLIVESAGQPSLSLRAIDETTLFIRGDGSTVTFELDSRGAVTGAVLQAGGAAARFKKTS